VRETRVIRQINEEEKGATENADLVDWFLAIDACLA
jgi:hypothetical protein